MEAISDGPNGRRSAPNRNWCADGFEHQGRWSSTTFLKGALVTYPPPWQSGPGGPPGGDPWQRAYPGYGYGYAPPPGTPPPYGKPPRSPLPWIVAAVAALLVAALVVGGLLWKLNGSDDEQRAASSTTTSLTKATTRSSTKTSTPRTTIPAPAPEAPTDCDGRVGTPVPETPAGWKQVVSPRGLIYDVPPEWQVLPCTTLVGWEKTCPVSPESPFGTCPIRSMSGAAELPNPACPDGNSLAVSGVPGAKTAPDIAKAAENETATVRDIYTSASGVVPDVSLSAPRDLTVAGAPAVEIVATVTRIAPESCNSASALHVMIATTVAGQPGSVMFVVSMGYEGTPDTRTIDTMVRSLRLAG